MNESRKKNDNEKYYDEEYYKNFAYANGMAYERGNGWEEVFGNHADRIVKEIAPKKTLDVGCAKGFLVEALRDRGVLAYGIDLSEYAVSKVREDIRQYCKAKSVLELAGETYDLITCIEVLEHLPQEQVPLAVKRLCEASDDILFSSTPFDYAEESHLAVHVPSYWAEQFAYHGFYHDVRYDCSYISIQAMRFRKGKKSKAELIREYEDEFFQKHQELVAAKVRYQTSQENVEIYKDAYQKHVDQINQELNPQILKLEALLGEKEAEKEKEKENLLKVERVRAAECVQKRLDEEVEKRRALEEENSRLHQKLEEAVEITSVLEQMICKRDFRRYSLHEVIKNYFQDKREEGNLLRMGMEYFAPVFDPGYYVSNNEDVNQLIGTDKKALLCHFISYGMYEGRRASEEFDVVMYAKYNLDVAKMFRNDLRRYYLHYIAYGKEEGRRAK